MTAGGSDLQSSFNVGLSLDIGAIDAMWCTL